MQKIFLCLTLFLSDVGHAIPFSFQRLRESLSPCALRFLDKKLPEPEQKQIFDQVKKEFESLNILDFIEAQTSLRASSSYTFIKKKSHDPREYCAHIMSFALEIDQQPLPPLVEVPFLSIIQSAMGIFYPVRTGIKDFRIILDLSRYSTRSLIKCNGFEAFKNEFCDRLTDVNNDLIALYGEEHKDFISNNLAKTYAIEINKMLAFHKLNPYLVSEQETDLLSFHTKNIAQGIQNTPYSDAYLQAFSSKKEILDFVQEYAEIGKKDIAFDATHAVFFVEKILKLSFLTKPDVIEIVELFNIDNKKSAQYLLSKDISPVAKQALVPIASCFLKHPIENIVRNTQKLWKKMKQFL